MRVARHAGKGGASVFAAGVMQARAAAAACFGGQGRGIEPARGLDGCPTAGRGAWSGGAETHTHAVCAASRERVCSVRGLRRLQIRMDECEAIATRYSTRSEPRPRLPPRAHARTMFSVLGTASSPAATSHFGCAVAVLLAPSQLSSPSCPSHLSSPLFSPRLFTITRFGCAVAVVSAPSHLCSALLPSPPSSPLSSPPLFTIALASAARLQCCQRGWSLDGASMARCSTATGWSHSYLSLSSPLLAPCSSLLSSPLKRATSTRASGHEITAPAGT